MLKLYDYYNSSAAYRVRIALNLKGLKYDTVAVHLRRSEQQEASYLAINPAALVPSLEEGGNIYTQSLAIIAYLDEAHPKPPLLPASKKDRAFVRAIAQTIACDIHPINNLRVLNYLREHFNAGEAAIKNWYREWIARGFAALEAQLEAGKKAGQTGKCCYGNQPTLADCCLIPQVYNARRFECDLKPYPILVGIDAHCRTLKPFISAAPENQPDAE